MEEAQLIATEYIATLDNLPAEMQHLLAEIRVKDDNNDRTLADVQNRSQKQLRSILRQSSESPSKDASASFDAQFAEMDRNCQDKIALAQRILVLLTRATGRLDVDIQRALAASGDNVPDTASHASLTPHPSTTWTSTRTATERIKESLKQELASSAPPSEPHSPAPSLSQPPPKKRRLNPSVAADSPAPSTPTPRSSRVTLQVARATRRSQSVIDNDHDPDQDAEGEADDEEAKDTGEPEDPTLYCYCRKLSYGEMVGCDNGDCPYQWFHLSCTGIKGDLPDSWYCSDCAPKFQFGGPSEKSRKGRRPRDRS